MLEVDYAALPLDGLRRINGTGQSAEPRISQPKFVAALSILRECWDYARETSGDRWEFAVEIDTLRSVGLSLNDLRWLVRMHYVEHAREVTQEEEDGRRFIRSGDLTFSTTTCFVLMERWIALAPDVSATSPTILLDSRARFHVGPDQPITPCWDAELRELRVGEMLVKRFKWQACNQEMVLATFEEDGWPPVIDDPLPPQPQQDPKRRLHDTIKSLNRHQFKEMVRFHGDGTGEGVRWELLRQND